MVGLISSHIPNSQILTRFDNAIYIVSLYETPTTMCPNDFFNARITTQQSSLFINILLFFPGDSNQFNYYLIIILKGFIDFIMWDQNHKTR